MRDDLFDVAWQKYDGNPVLGGSMGTCFDICVLPDEGGYRMWLSWRPKRSIAHSFSADGLHWSEPVEVLGPELATGWEDDINRPSVIRCGNVYHMWYTGQAGGASRIGYATSTDGLAWVRGRAPAVEPDRAWEKVAVMCPDCCWNAKKGLFRMWYSGGEQYEPDAIGYAESEDGIVWRKPFPDPVFSSDAALEWEAAKVTACQVIPTDDWHYMLYIGFRDVHNAAIGVARSRDGIGGWQRFAGNPVISPTPGAWDGDAVYKPFAVFDGSRWLLWYNGRREHVEQIGVAIGQANINL